MMTTCNADGRATINKGIRERRRIICGFNGSIEEDGIVYGLILRSLNAGFCRGNNCAKIAALMWSNFKASVILCHAASPDKYVLIQHSPLYLC
jgi:hypothetical protein